MDILNFISWIKGGRTVTTVDPAKTLLPVGLKDDRRDDGYLAGAISVEDLATQIGGLQTVEVDGITITGDGTLGDPLVAVVPTPSYKVYTAYYNVEEDILQVYENTIGSINFSYDSPNNQVIITSVNLFGPLNSGTPEKTAIFLTIRNGIQNTINGLEGIVSTSSEIRVSDGSGSSGAMLNYSLKFFIEIRVYN